MSFEFDHDKERQREVDAQLQAIIPSLSEAALIQLRGILQYSQRHQVQIDAVTIAKALQDGSYIPWPDLPDHLERLANPGLNGGRRYELELVNQPGSPEDYDAMHAQFRSEVEQVHELVSKHDMAPRRAWLLVVAGLGPITNGTKHEHDRNRRRSHARR